MFSNILLLVYYTSLILIQLTIVQIYSTTDFQE